MTLYSITSNIAQGIDRIRVVILNDDIIEDVQVSLEIFQNLSAFFLPIVNLKDETKKMIKSKIYSN